MRIKELEWIGFYPSEISLLPIGESHLLKLSAKDRKKILQIFGKIRFYRDEEKLLEEVCLIIYKKLFSYLKKSKTTNTEIVKKC